ncbi:DUF2752 domain-containing protein [Streptomyces sp. enrichment culture]|uniref:DUF2752 domain-containing protein n=1 Tax=Streptomyces sp. enrichment culture TaxID=1795815 RepID=UPI003F57290B
MSGDNRRVDATTPPPAHPEPLADAAHPAHAAPPGAAADAAPPGAAAHAPYAHAGPPPPPPLHRRLLAPLGTLAGVAAAFAYVGAVDPNEPGHYPACPLLRYTGLYCPGCGGLRSAHAFVHGDLPAALGANAMAVAGYAAFAVFMVYWLVRAVRGLPVRLNPRPLTLWVIGGVWAVFVIVRNLPFGSALVP